MNSKYIKINGKNYFLDMDAIMKWCLSSQKNVTTETELNEGYDVSEEGDLTMVSKVVRELKGSNPQDDTIKYDFIKMILVPIITEVPDFNEIEENLSLSLLFNTLIKMEFLKEIE